MLRKYHTLARMNPVIFNKPSNHYYFIQTVDQLNHELDFIRTRLNFSSPATRHLYFRYNNSHQTTYNPVIDEWIYANRVNHNVAEYLLLFLSDFPRLTPFQVNTWKICCQEIIIYNGLLEYVTGITPTRDNILNLIKHEWETPIGVPPEFGRIYKLIS